jgi:LmbE family N-acetylglucosaminyl deacetylase
VGRWAHILGRAARRLVPRGARSELAARLWDFEAFTPLHVLERPPSQRTLVLAPHPDDESIGCGGTLAKLTDAGASVKVVFLTDGEEGDRALRALADGDPRKAELRRELSARRRREAGEALSILAVADSEFLGGRDGALDAGDRALVERLAGVFDGFRPDLVLLPFVADRHPDHRAATPCLLAALDLLGDRRLETLACAGYEVWSPAQPNALVDISAETERKRAAICAYASQMAETDYADGALALNRYRAVSGLLRGRYAEALHLAPVARLREMCERLGL